MWVSGRRLAALLERINYKQSDITWYTNKRSLHFHGKEGIVLKNLLIKFCKDVVICKPSDVLNSTLSNSQSNIDNTNIENCVKCHDYSRLFTEMAQVRSKLEIVCEKVEDLSMLAPNVCSTRVGNGEIKATCEIDTQTCELFQQGTERQGYDAQCSWVDLSTEIEGLKLDIVIAESKAAGNFQSNKQAIDKLRNELNTIKGENQKCLPDNANSNQNENNGILQNQPCMQSQTKEQNSIESTQDLRSDITKANSVIIESENYRQTSACTSKDQGRRTQADKSVKVRSNTKLLYSSSQLNIQTTNDQNIDRKPQQIRSKDINSKSRANRSKNQHEWINRLPLIGSSSIRPPKKQPPPTKKFKQRWRTAK